MIIKERQIDLSEADIAAARAWLDEESKRIDGRTEEFRAWHRVVASMLLIADERKSKRGKR